MSAMLFRVLCFVMAAFLIAAALVSLGQEIPQAQVFASTVPIGRSDKLAQLQAHDALASGNPNQMRRAHQSLEEVLQFSPFDANLWALLATLRSRIEFGSVGTAQALKLSYLTAPSAAYLIEARLLVAASTDVQQDSEIQELARGDLRLIITRRPDMFGIVQSAYRRGSASGRAFLESATRSIDPAFVPRLKLS